MTNQAADHQRQANWSGAEAGAEQNQAERHREFIVELTAQLTLQGEPAALVQTATTALGGFIRATRCHFSELDPAGERITVLPEWRQPGASTIAGDYPLESLLSLPILTELRRGEVIVVAAATSDPRTTALAHANPLLFAHSFVAAPYLREGQLSALLVVEAESGRHWRPADVVLVESVLRRTWPLVEQARIQGALRSSEERYRALFEHASDAIFIADDNRRYVDVNAAACALSGYSRAELLGDGAQHQGMTLNDLTPPEDLLRLDQDRRRLLTAPVERQTQVGEWRLLCKDGRRIPVEVSARQLPDGRWQAFVRDISQRKAAAAAAQASEARFRQLADAMPQMVWMCNDQGMVDYVNERWLSYTQMTLAETLQHGLWPAIHPDDYQRNRAQWEEAVQTGVTYEAEVRLRRADGEYRWHLERAIPTRDEQGQIQRWFGTSTEIHQQKQSQADARFLAEVGEHIRRAETSDTLIGVVLALLAEHLAVRHVRFGETDATHTQTTVQHWDAVQGVNTLATHELGEFSPETIGDMQQGRTVVVEQSSTDPRTAPHYASVYAPVGSESFVNVPLLRNGLWVANLSVADGRARRWTERERTLLQTVAERLWLAVERLRLDAELRASESKYRFLAEAMPQFVWITRPGGAILYYNRYFCDYTGLTPEEALRGEWSPVVHPADRARAIEWWEEVHAAGKGAELEYRFWSAQEGIFVWFLEHIRPVYNEEGILVQWISTAVNIDERKRAELNRDFLLRLDGQIRLLTEPEQIIQSASQLLGEHLAVNRVHFVEIEPATEQATVQLEWRRLGPPLSGSGPLAALLPPELQRICLAGETIAVADVQTNPWTAPVAATYLALSTRAFAATPHMLAGRWVALLLIHNDEPRLWRADELALLESVLARVWPLVERARSLKILRDNERRLRLAQAAGRMGSFEWELEGNTVTLDEPFAQLHGLPFTPDPVDVDPIFAYIHPEDLSNVQRVLANVIANGTLYELEFRWQLPGGEVRWIASRGNVLRSAEDGRALRLIGINWDISERKWAELALRESEERFRMMADTAPVMIWLSGLERGCTFFNQPWLDFTGRTMTQELGDGWLDNVHPDDRQGCLAIDKAAFAARQPLELEYRLRRHDGLYRWMLDRGVPRFAADGRFIGYVGSCIDITERKQAEEQASFYAYLLENMQDAVIAMQTDYTITAWNRGAERLYGWHTAEVLGRDVRQIIRTQASAEAHDSQRQLVDGASRSRFETVHARRDGQWIEIESVTVALGEANAITGYLSINRDISERKQGEVALRESAARFRQLADAMPQIVWISRASGEIEHLNQRWYEYSGLTVAESLGYGANQLIHGDDFARAHGGFSGAVATGEPFEIEFRLRRADGVYRWHLARGAPIHNGLGEVINWYCTATDVHELKEAETAIRRSEEHLRRATERFEMAETASNGFVYEWDIQTGQVQRSQNFAAVLGYQPDEIENQATWWQSLIHPEDQESGRARGVANPEHYDSYGVEYRVRHAAGHYIHLWDRGHIIRNEQGIPVRVVGSSVDISVRKRLEQELRHLNATLERQVEERTAELQRSNRELDQFAYVASHDLKAPLRAIQHLSTWIAQDAAAFLPPASHDHLNKLQGRIKRMEALLDDLLAYSRAGRLRHPPERVQLDSLVRGVVDLLGPPTGFTVHLANPPDPFVTERVALETVLRNLLGNAIKHHDRPAEGRVVITAIDHGAWVEFAIADNGPGIDPAFHGRIFEIFQTLKPRDQVEGSGIGLTVVKKLVESRGGSVTVQSTPAAGATFCFTWPK